GNRLMLVTARKMWQSNGIVTFFRGLPLGIVAVFPYAAINIIMRHYLRSFLAGSSESTESDFYLHANLISVTLSSALGMCIVYPLSVLQTRLQVEGTALHQRTYESTADVARRTIRIEGIHGLYRGVVPT